MKEKTMIWIENNQKKLLLAMVLILFTCLVALIIGQFLRKSDKESDPFKKLKETSQKAKKFSKTSYSELIDVNELYQKSKAIMQKDSLTKEDYAYLKIVDSTLKSMIKKK